MKYWALALLVLSASCNDSEFDGASRSKKAPITKDEDAQAAAPQPDPPIESEVPIATSLDPQDGEVRANLNFTYAIKVADGAEVIRPAIVDAIPSVYNHITQRPVSDNEALHWQVKIQLEGNAEAPLTALAPQKLDLSASAGLVRTSADFSNTKLGMAGKAEQSLFVDGEAPQVKLLRISNSSSGDVSRIVWSATDNYKIDEAKLVLLACADYVLEFTPVTRSELDILPAGCAIVSSGKELAALDAQLDIAAMALKLPNLLPRDARFALYAEDMVGYSAFTWIAPVAQEMGTLTLSAAPGGLQYTNKTAASGSLKLLEVKGGLARQLELAHYQPEWINYALAVAANPALNAPAQNTFSASVPLVLGPTEGPHAFEFQVRNGGLASNKQSLSYIYDKTPPRIGSIQVVIDKVIPSATSKVSLSWTVEELYGVASQMLEIKLAGATTWTKVADIAANARSFTFDWGSRESKNFELRISATDRATNKGTGIGAWARQIFNAAVLTSSVQCYFCHTRIEGDLGGINFPADVRHDTGRNFAVTSKIYGTNAVPSHLAQTAKGGSVPNYDNSGFKIFPKDNKFPVLSQADLGPKMKGTLKLGSSVNIDKIHKGNLVLDGTVANQPILINGEVLIEGDLIIKGQYKGIGTIYANNIYIVDDVKAVKSPFPFSQDPLVAQAQAQASVLAGDDGLYLGALGQVVIGVVENGLPDEENNSQKLVRKNPYAWISKNDFSSLGRQAVWPKNLQGAQITLPLNNCCSGDPTTDPRFKLEVNRVDAYIYAQELVSWRAYSNVLLNGGFMSPKGGFVTRLPEVSWGRSDLNQFAPNPRNGMSVNQNVIRYDYRLRIGGGGLETIKGYFDQN